MTTATAKSAKTDPKYTVENLSENIQAKIKIIDAGTTINEKGETVFEPGLHDKLLAASDIESETYVKVNEHNAEVYAAGAYVMGQKGVPVLKKNEELTAITATLSTTGKDVIAFGVKRSSPYTLRDADGKVTGTGTSFGSVTVDHKIYATKSRGELAKVKSIISDLATAQLS